MAIGDPPPMIIGDPTKRQSDPFVYRDAEEILAVSKFKEKQDDILDAAFFVLYGSLKKLSKEFCKLEINRNTPYPIRVPIQLENKNYQTYLNTSFVEGIFKETMMFSKLKNHFTYRGCSISINHFKDSQQIRLDFDYHPHFAYMDGFSIADQMFLTFASDWMKRCHEIASKQISASYSPNGMFIAGGALSRYYWSIISDHYINNGDVDFWFTNYDIRDMLRQKFGNGNYDVANSAEPFKSYTDSKGNRLNGGIINLRDMDPYFNMPFQFILYKDMNKGNLEFDFLHCETIYDPELESLLVTPTQLRAIKEKVLVPLKENIEPVRIEKYTNMGWRLAKQSEKEWYADYS